MFARGTYVHDTYWPLDLGRVVKRLKTRVYVRFAQKGLVRYDRAHARAFLRRYR